MRLNVAPTLLAITLVASGCERSTSTPAAGLESSDGPYAYDKEGKTGITALKWAFSTSSNYTIDDSFLAAATQLAARGELQLDHHSTIVASDGRVLCDSLDNFTIVTLADDLKSKIKGTSA